MIKAIKKLKELYNSKNSHFLYVDYNFYKVWKYLILIIIHFNKNYVSCEIFRKKYKTHINIVVVGLKWSGKNVKRRTSGYAKEYVLRNRDAKCIYCDVKLTNSNATSDHILPISHGGNNTQVNLVICCRNCNSERGNIKFLEYLKFKKKINIKNIFI